MEKTHGLTQRSDNPKALPEWAAADKKNTFILKMTAGIGTLVTAISLNLLPYFKDKVNQTDSPAMAHKTPNPSPLPDSLLAKNTNNGVKPENNLAVSDKK